MTRYQGFVLLLGLAFTAFGQIDTGSIVGTVRDSSGASIPNAAITLTNKATNVSLNTTSNDAGEYQFNALHPGSYSLKAAVSGFSAQQFSDVQIDVQSRQSVDFTLQVGNVTQTMEVQSTTPLLNTQTADVGGVVQQQQIRDLPLNGRRYADLALLEPGIQKNLTNPNNTAPDRFSSNGNLETQNYFSLDGVDNNSGSTNLQEGSVQTVQPPPDALTGVSCPDPHLFVGVRHFRGRGHQRVDQERDRTGFTAMSGSSCATTEFDANTVFEQRGRRPARAFQPESVWRHHRRPGYQGQDFLLLRHAEFHEP